MLSWFQAMLPKDGKFFDLFERHGEVLCGGAATLRKILCGGPETARHCAVLSAQENQADLITRDVLLTVRRTLITPFDRTDIRDLISSMDDAIDQMHKTAKTIVLYGLTEFAPDMVAIGELIERATTLTAEALPLLRTMRANAARLNQIAEEIGQLEEQSDQLYDSGMMTLFQTVGKVDPMGFIIGSMIYEHLEKVVDRLEDVANEISGVLMEQL